MAILVPVGDIAPSYPLPQPFYDGGGMTMCDHPTDWIGMALASFAGSTRSSRTWKRCDRFPPPEQDTILKETMQLFCGDRRKFCL